MKMEPIVSSETSAIRTQTPGNYPKRNKLQFHIYQSLDMRRIQCAVGQVLAVGGDGLRSSGVWRDVFWLLGTSISGQLIGTTVEGQVVQAQRHKSENWSLLFAFTRRDQQNICALEEIWLWGDWRKFGYEELEEIWLWRAGGNLVMKSWREFDYEELEGIWLWGAGGNLMRNWRKFGYEETGGNLIMRSFQICRHTGHQLSYVRLIKAKRMGQAGM